MKNELTESKNLAEETKASLSSQKSVLDDKKKASIPIIAMTANVFEEDRKKAVEKGMNGFISKPVDINKLFETLSQIIRK